MRAKLEDEAHKIMLNQWWKNMMALSTINAIVALWLKNKNGETAKLVQDITRSKKTRKTRRVPLKNIFFKVDIGRKHLDSHTPWRYLYSCNMSDLCIS